MRKLLLTLLAASLVCVLAAPALAMDPASMDKPGQKVETYEPAAAKATFTETEPNNDCATANGPIVAGDAWNAMISPAGDADWFRVETSVCVDAVFETAPQAGQANMDTYLELYKDPDCTTRIAYDDDSGVASFSRLALRIQPGTYYVKIRAYSATTTGTYYALTYTAVECPAPPPNDTCSTAIDIQAQGLTEWDVSTCSGNNDYGTVTTGATCTNYAANGLDVVYKITLLQGETFTATQAGTPDMSLYLVTDCSNIAGTCLDGSDNCCAGATESVQYQNTGAAPLLVYLIVDAYSANTCGTYHITINSPVATDARSWGATKALYR